MKREIAIGSDHAGYFMKEKLKEYLKEKGFAVRDFGTDSAESCDYPDFASKVAHYVAEKKLFGILFCATGIGMSIAANKVRGIRAARCCTVEDAQFSRRHNNVNILALGARTADTSAAVDTDTAVKIVDAFLNTGFESGGRHERRVNKIMLIEEER